MNDRRVPDPFDDEQLSAYLLGDLSHADAAALERALADDPQRAARLDALADAMAVLGGVDDAVLPDGFEQRLAHRLEGGAQIVDLDYERRARRTQWMAGAAAVAVMVFGAVFATNMLGGTDQGSMGGDAMESAQAPEEGPLLLDSKVAIADEMALQRRYSDLPEVAALLGTDADEAPALAQTYAAAVPASLEDYPPAEMYAQEENATDQLAVGDGGGGGGGGERTRADRDVSQSEIALSGSAASASGPAQEGAPPPAGAVAPATKNGDAADAAEEKDFAFEQSMRRSGRATVRSCLREISADATEPLVPARIETLRYAGKRAFAYVLVTASPDSPELDRTELWVVARDDCSTLVFHQY